MGKPATASTTYTTDDVFTTLGGLLFCDLDLQGRNAGDNLKLFDIQISPNTASNIISISTSSSFQRGTDGHSFQAAEGGGAGAGYVKVTRLG